MAQPAEAILRTAKEIGATVVALRVTEAIIAIPQRENFMSYDIVRYKLAWDDSPREEIRFGGNTEFTAAAVEQHIRGFGEALQWLEVEKVRR